MKYIALGLILTAASPASAQYCFGRYFDDAHLRGHPQQTVQEIFFGTLTGRPILQVRLAGRQNYIYGYADCRDSGARLNCELENDQGNFSVEGRPDGTLLLRVGNRDVMLERGGEQETVLLQHDAGDDRTFLLYSGKGCIN